MRLFYQLTLINFLTIISLCEQDNTNTILRTWVPWWPKNEESQFKSMPQNITKDNNFKIGNSSEIGKVDGTMQNLESAPVSPLDSSRDSKRSSSQHSFAIDFSSMSECPRDCSNDLRDTLSLALKDMSHVERYRKICDKYTGALECVNEDARCEDEDRGMFEALTSGLQYMCVEQELAFNATIKCIDDQSGLVQSECEQQCQTKNLFMNWIMRSAMADTIQQGVSGIVGAATGANPNSLAFLQGDQAGWASVLQAGGQASPEAAQQGLDNLRQFTNDLCRIGDCMLDCIRSKFNTRCEGSAGTLLSEVFVRPIAVSQDKLSVLRPVLGMFMPEQCAYMYSNSDLKKHRIDATMDSELKRMYSEKVAKEMRERAAQDELLSSMVPLDENGVPLPRALPELHVKQESPLDGGTKSLDQLILEMYSNNVNKKGDSEKDELLTSEEGSSEGSGDSQEGSAELDTEDAGILEGSGDRVRKSEGSGDLEGSGETNFNQTGSLIEEGSADNEGSGELNL